MLTERTYLTDSSPAFGGGQIQMTTAKEINRAAFSAWLGSHLEILKRIREQAQNSGDGREKTLATPQAATEPHQEHPPRQREK
jgi:hypothetical protein